MLVDIHSPCGTGTTHVACTLLCVHTASSNTCRPHEGNGVAQSPTTRTHRALQSCASLHVAKIKLSGARLLNWLLKYKPAGFERNLYYRTAFQECQSHLWSSGYDVSPTR